MGPMAGRRRVLRAAALAAALAAAAWAAGPGGARARGRTVEVLAVSGSGRSLVLGIGAGEGVAAGDSATLVETGPGREPVPVAAARAVKVHDTRSYWLVEADPAGAGPPVRGARYLFDSPDRAADVLEVGDAGPFFPGDPPAEGPGWTDVAVEEPPPPSAAPGRRGRTGYAEGRARHVEAHGRALGVVRPDPSGGAWEDGAPPVPAAPRGAVDPAAAERIAREGPRWSAGMTREEMREWMVAHGVAEERARRERALRGPPGHEFFLRVATGLSSEARTDRPGGRGIGLAASLGYEFLLGRTSPRLRPLAVFARAGRGADSVPLRTTNAEARHTFFGMGVNYYPLAPPESLNRYVPFLGLGFARGDGEMEAPGWGAPAAHAVFVVSLRAGLKYRFGGAGPDRPPLDWGLSLLWEARGAEYAIGPAAEKSGVFDTGVQTRENRIALGVSAHL